MTNQIGVHPWQGVSIGREASTDAAFTAMVDAHYRRTYNLIYRMIRSEQDAADLTQEVFVRVYRAMGRLRAECAAGAWIRRIATNLCLDYLRRRNATPPTSSLDAPPGPESESMASWEIVDPASGPEGQFDTAESARVLNRAIDSLPRDYRVVIILHHLEEMRVEEIADALNVPAGTIKSRLSRARRELRRKLIPFFDPTAR